MRKKMKAGLLAAGVFLLFVIPARACSDTIAVYSVIILGTPHHGENSGIRDLLCLPLNTTIAGDTLGALSLKDAYAAEQQYMIFSGIGAVNASNLEAKRLFARLPKIKAYTEVTVLGVYYSGDGVNNVQRVHSIPPDPNHPDPLGRDKLRELALIRLSTGAKLYVSAIDLAAVQHILRSPRGRLVRIGPSK